MTQFASVLYDPSDVVEVRLIPAPSRVRDLKPYSEWCYSSKLDTLVEKLTVANDAGYGIYAGANPRKAHGARKDESVVLARCFFIDYDDTDAADADARRDSAGLPRPTLTRRVGGTCTVLGFEVSGGGLPALRAPLRRRAEVVVAGVTGGSAPEGDEPSERGEKRQERQRGGERGRPVVGGGAGGPEPRDSDDGGGRREGGESGSGERHDGVPARHVPRRAPRREEPRLVTRRPEQEEARAGADEDRGRGQGGIAWRRHDDLTDCARSTTTATNSSRESAERIVNRRRFMGRPLYYAARFFPPAAGRSPPGGSDDVVFSARKN